LATRSDVEEIPAVVTAGDAGHTTDVGNAARFARDHAGNVRYCSQLGWLVWDTTRHQVDDVGHMERLARETIKSIYAEAAGASTPDDRKRLAAWAVASESRTGVRSMLSLAESEYGIATSATAFDRHPWLLNTLSGLVDLRTGECHPHDPKYLVTRLAPVFYRPINSPPCPRWLSFLDRIMSGNLELIEFLQRAVGYSLTGDTGEHVLFMSWGSGANGKSTLLEVLRAILGDYSAHTPTETLMIKTGGGGIPNDVARLRGARFVTAVETEDGRRLAEGLVKQLTGGDTLTARFLHREFFEFKPAFKLWLSTNHRPIIRGTDYAIWRRLRLIPFTVTIPKEERIPGLADQLFREEAAGILGWAVTGCLEWQRIGLREPEAVLLATAEYRKDMDPLSDFVEDRCELAEDLEAAADPLYAAYKAWAETNGRPALGVKRFKSTLEGHEGIQYKRRKNGRFYLGLAVKP
jgi:putative DNA primase/helicase